MGMDIHVEQVYGVPVCEFARFERTGPFLKKKYSEVDGSLLPEKDWSKSYVWLVHPKDGSVFNSSSPGEFKAFLVSCGLKHLSHNSRHGIDGVIGLPFGEKFFDSPMENYYIEHHDPCERTIETVDIALEKMKLPKARRLIFIGCSS